MPVGFCRGAENDHIPTGTNRTHCRLVLENRSFDNLLGWLYDPASEPPLNRQPPPNFEGVCGKNLRNLTPDDLTTAVGKGTDVTKPYPLRASRLKMCTRKSTHKRQQ
jgi:phospholipase C